MLKPTVTTAQTILALPAAFRRLCVETPWVRLELRQRNQPPLGGCVLKRVSTLCLGAGRCPAAFGRLCVETLHEIAQAVHQTGQPPSGGCVLKHLDMQFACRRSQPAAFGRLCVETTWGFLCSLLMHPAAFGRLCVETKA